MTLGEVLPESFPNWERPLNLIQLILAEEMEQLNDLASIPTGMRPFYLTWRGK
jgi:hypothetical protein